MELGTDIKSDWSISNGDISLVSEADNVAQAVVNRLSCYQPSMAIYYDAYGGFLSNYLGMRKTEESLGFMKIELDSILAQEERLTGYESTLEYNSSGSVDARVVLNVEGEDVELNLIIDRDGVSSAG